MWKLILVVAFLSAVPSTSHAAPVCVVGTLDSYVALGAGGCSIGSSTFADFSATSMLGGATPILPASVTVIPSSIPALDFALVVSAGAGDLFDILIHYSVTGGLFGANSLDLSGASAGGDGVVLAIEDACIGGTYAGPIFGCSGSPVTLIALKTAIDSIPTATATFPVTSFVDVFTEITIDGGLSGMARLDGAVRNAFVPEPSTVLLIGSALSALLARRQRRS
jgi:hypothetical protein